MRKRLIPYAIFSILISGCINQNPATTIPSPSLTEEAIKISFGIPYVVNGDPLQALDIYEPGGDDQVFPTLMIIHGSGTDKSDWSITADDFAKEGYAVVAVNYRGIPQYSLLDSVQDVYCALAWLHANSSDYRIDLRHIVVLGFSLGGTLASLIGTVDETTLFTEECPNSLPEKNIVSGVVSAAGIFDLVQAADASVSTHDLLVGSLGAEPEDAPKIWAQLSPIEWVDGSEPPFLIIQGLKDTRVNPEQARDFAARLQEVGVKADLVLIPLADHDTLLSSEEYQQAVETFLAILSKPD